MNQKLIIRNGKNQMKRIKIIATLLIILSFQDISAQGKKWTLEDCINYAVTNNITLKRQMLLTETAQVNLLKSQMDVLPSLNAGSDASIQYGRSIDPITNGVTFLQNFRNGYSATSSLKLFNGFTTLNTILPTSLCLRPDWKVKKLPATHLLLT